MKSEKTVSAQQFPGQFLSPHVFSAYYTPFSKSLPSLLIFTFTNLTYHDAKDEKKSIFYPYLTGDTRRAAAAAASQRQ